MKSDSRFSPELLLTFESISLTKHGDMIKTQMIVLLIALTIHIKVNAQDLAAQNVPAVVLNTFKTNYPNAQDVEWKMKGDLYKVEFEVGKRDHDLWIDKSGVIKKQKEDFPKGQLPAAILQKLQKDFSAYKIDDVDKIQENGQVFYQVELDGSADDRKLLFTASGELKENVLD